MIQHGQYMDNGPHQEYYESKMKDISHFQVPKFLPQQSKKDQDIKIDEKVNCKSNKILYESEDDKR